MRLTVASKGFGAENMSALRMFTPADGTPAVKQFVIDTIDRAGANACPPVVVGVGVGGTFEMAALLAKKAVLRPIDIRHPQPETAAGAGGNGGRQENHSLGTDGGGGRGDGRGGNSQIGAQHRGGGRGAGGQGGR